MPFKLNRRIVVAFIISPLVGAVYLAALDVPLLSDPDRVGFAVMVVVYAVVGYAAEFVLGLPLLMWFYRYGRLKLRWFLAGAVLIGVIFAVPFFLAVFLSAGVPRALGFGFLYCIAPAVLSTLVFWFVGWAGDKKSPNNSCNQISELSEMGN